MKLKIILHLNLKYFTYLIINIELILKFSGIKYSFSGTEEGNCKI